VWQLVGRQRRKYGGYLVHAGVILMAIGIIGTRMYPFETERVLALGEPVEVGEYTLIYEDLGQEILEDRIATWASIALYRGGDYLTTLEPRIDRYVGFETVGIPAVRPGLREDVYLVLAAVPGDAFSVSVKIFIESLASFLWLGGLVFLAGGAIALWPPAQSARLTVPEARRRTVGTVAGLAAGLAILVLAGWAMWGTGQGTASLDRPAAVPAPTPGARSSERIRPGQPAPDFTVELLDGPELSLSELRGQVVVVNFWAPWCEPCEEELPDFQRLWEGYQEQDVLFLGLAFEEDEADVREMMAELGITYPIALDVEDRISAAYGITGIPETFVVDAEGNVAYVHVGPVTGGVLGEQLDSLLEE
jgi:peroxiredoxin